MPRTVEDWLRIIYVVFSFCTALCFGALKSVLVGPVAALIMIFGNVGVILGLFTFTCFLDSLHPSQAHTLQLEAFSLAIKNLDEDLPKQKLQFVSSCRNEADETRLQNLKDQAIELKVDEHVEFFKNDMPSSVIGNQKLEETLSTL